MGRRRTANEWRDFVFASPHIKDNVRVLLLFLAEHMTTDRKVSVPRATIAAKLGKTERRVTERITAAHRAGFLSTVSPGHVGRTAVYQGLFPEVESGRNVRPLSGDESGSILSPLSSAETRPLSKRERGRNGGPTTTTADLPLRGNDRDVSSDEGACEHGMPFGDRPDPWFRDRRLACPECALETRNHTTAREETA